MVCLGDKIKALRLGKHLTQAEVAQRIGVSKAMISSYELSSRAPSYDILVKIAVFFGVTTDYLLGIEQARAVSLEGLGQREAEMVVAMIDLLRER